MDKRVFFLIFSILILGAILFFINILSDSCEDFEIVMSPEQPRVGDIVTFTSSADDPESIKWNFSDHVTDQGGEVKRQFSEAKSYEVSAEISKGCKSKAFTANVLPKRAMETVVPRIDVPGNIYAGERVSFSDQTSEASEWNWKVLETGITENKKIFSTVFAKPGQYNLALQVKGEFINGGDTITIKVRKPAPIVVQPKPKQTAVAKPAKPYVPPPPPVERPPKESVVTPKPVTKNYLKDAEFEEEFVRIANMLGSEGNSSSQEWKDIIVSQAGSKGTFKVLLVQDQREPREQSLESFKSKQLIASSSYTVNSVTDIQRSKDNSINSITISVSK